MTKLFFFYPVLRALSNGKVIRTSVAIILRVLAILSVLGGLYTLVEILKIAFQLPTEGTFGGVLFAIIFVVTILVVAQILWYRADCVQALGDSPFTVIPIVALLLRAMGEVYASMMFAVGLGGCLFVWFAKLNPFGLMRGFGGFMPAASPDASFLGGISFLLYMTFVSFLALMIFYFLAESSVVLVDIAKNVRLLVGHDSAAAADAPSAGK